MTLKKVILISPPFSSQLMPTLALAHAFHEEGLHTIVACGEPFRERIDREGLEFLPLLVNRNANTGIAQQTQQPEEERTRLHSFLASTKRGAVAALLQQSMDRRKDMFADPLPLFSDLEKIDRSEQPDLWVANQLSYAVTLVLYCLDFPFITFCPPHPLTIPRGSKTYGVPASWPSNIPVDQKALDTLVSTARDVEKDFTDEFNRIIGLRSRHGRAVSNAFRLSSQEAVLYNYPDFGEGSCAHDDTRALYLGSCFRQEPLPHSYKKLLEESRDNVPKILIALGTFLSYRDDVLKTCIAGVKQHLPNSMIFVGAGASTKALQKLHLEHVYVEEYIPQKGLMPHMDLIIHHGGNNSFTESLHYGKPMIIMPFSSDQFDIASDAERHRLAQVLDPNSLSPEKVAAALKRALSKDHVYSLSRWQRHVQSRGPGYAVRKLLEYEQKRQVKHQ
jgi:UDP:flavonoid glycosyltransferase YjiC (YdhE family)